MTRQFTFISIQTNFIEAYFSFGVFRAAMRQQIEFKTVNLRDFAVDKHGSIDESPFGPGRS